MMFLTKEETPEKTIFELHEPEMNPFLLGTMITQSMPHRTSLPCHQLATIRATITKLVRHVEGGTSISAHDRRWSNNHQGD
jgi:hypothetical protein